MQNLQNTEPLLEAVDKLKQVLSQLCVRGLQFMDAKQLQLMRQAEEYFAAQGAEYLAAQIREFIAERESNAPRAARLLLSLQTRCHMFERQISYQKAKQVLACWDAHD